LFSWRWATAEQDRKIRRATTPEGEAQGPAASQNVVQAGEALKKTIDVLDEINAVLEKNGDALVKSYVQRGGQLPVFEGP
jgi:ubiquitin-like protein Pup